MKVIFLDFDGVLNSSASFMVEAKKRRRLKETDLEAYNNFHVNEQLCHVCTSNFQYILDKTEDVKIVISSSWRNHFSMEELKAKLDSYFIDSSRIIGKTPTHFRRYRGHEIAEWLEDHPEVTDYVIIDDSFIGNGYEEKGKVVQTSWLSGLTLGCAMSAIGLLGGDCTGSSLPL